MGKYINPGYRSFQTSINSEIYIDKTELIKYTNKFINSESKYLCVSRPRRFGKTMTINMLSAYYDITVDGKALFSRFKIASDSSFQQYANKFNVIRLNMVQLWQGVNEIDGMLAKLNRLLMLDLKRIYPDVEYTDDMDIIESMSDVYCATDAQFVVLIDEWDVIFREREHDFDGQKKYLDFLRAWLKNQDYIALAYMTGILPVKKYGNHSALNMFEEFSMERPGVLAPFVGFTSDEVQVLCEEKKMSYEECKAWYDGYILHYNTHTSSVPVQLVQHAVECYSPWSLTKAMIWGECNDYWNRTDTYEALQIYIQLNFDGLRDKIIGLMAGQRYKIDVTAFTNDMISFKSIDDVFTLMIHLGYLGYDNRTKEVFIPNNEVRQQYYTSIKDDVAWNMIADSIRNSDELLEATLNQDEDKVAELLELAHLETAHLQYNDENALSYTISLAYFTAKRKYNIFRELPTGKGFADMAFIPMATNPQLPAILVELKWDKSTKTAIDQILEKSYMERFRGYEGNILLVGVNYDKKSRVHTCEIIKG